MAKQEARLSFIAQMSDLSLFDDSFRWKAIATTIVVGAFAGTCELVFSDVSVDDSIVSMGIVMVIAAVILIAIKSLLSRSGPRLSAGRDISKWGDKTPQKALVSGLTISVVAAAFGTLNFRYQARSLTNEFSNALKSNDYARIASVTEQAATVSDHLHKALLLKSDQTFIAATKQPATWNAVLVSLQRIPVTPPPINQLVFKPMEHAVKIFPGAFISGGAFDVSAVTGDAIERGISEVNHSLPILDGTIIKSGRQTLDGFEWRNVTFVGTHIFYKGGAVKLEGARFVNCTFDLPPDTKGAKLAQYVALTLPTLGLGIEA